MRRRIGTVLLLLFILIWFGMGISCTKKKMKPNAQNNQVQTEIAQNTKTEKEDTLSRETDSYIKKVGLNKFQYEDIYFEKESYKISPLSINILKSKAAWLKENPDVKIVIEAHCDENGTNEHNIAMGEKRAGSVIGYLIELGIEGTRLKAVSYGEENPVDPAHDEEAWAKNRRVRFAIDQY